MSPRLYTRKDKMIWSILSWSGDGIEKYFDSTEIYRIFSDRLKLLDDFRYKKYENHQQTMQKQKKIVNLIEWILIVVKIGIEVWDLYK